MMFGQTLFAEGMVKKILKNEDTKLTEICKMLNECT